MSGRLVRTQHDRMIAGVCGGLARYLNIDSVLVRLAFVLFTLAGGSGLLVYLVLLIVMPIDSAVSDAGAYDSVGPDERRRRTTTLVGAGLVLIGTWYLLGRIPGLAWLSFHNLWPLVLIAAGVAMLMVYLRGSEGLQ